MGTLATGQPITVQYQSQAFTQLVGLLQQEAMPRQGTLVAFVAGSHAEMMAAAAALATQLGRPLEQIGISSIGSEYIGETEKNLARRLAAAADAGANLLFDEADALFGRRTNVRDAPDRYASLNLDSLLTLLSRHRVMVIALFDNPVRAERPRKDVRQVVVRFLPH